VAGVSCALEALGQSAVFAGLSPETLEAVADAMETLPLAGGQRLFAQGDAGDAAYVVLSGRVRVERGTGAATQVVREVGRGELIGEFTMLTGAPRTASVRAIRHCELGRIPRERFEALVARHPGLALGIGRNLARLLAEAPAAPRAQSAMTVVVLRPLAPAGRDLAATAASLERALRTIGRCAVLTSASAVEALGGEAMRDLGAPGHALGVARWLQRVEAEHDFVLCVADGAHPGWDDACVSHADLLLDVLPADSDAMPDRARPGPDVDRARDLVIVHEGERRRPTLAAAYMEARRYEHRHHVRAGRASDFDALARRLTGRRIGVALSGGGARGLAHIGFLRAAAELGIPIDEIGGTSMGALVAAQWASGMSIQEMTEAHRAGWRRHRPHKAYTLPLIGLVRAQAMDDMLREMFGSLDYADCWIDAFACSCNLTAACMTVHRSGGVVEACMASMAIPGLGPAITMPDRSLHVDGGLVSNLPARQVRAGIVIASDVSGSVSRDSGYPSTPSAWDVLRDRWRPAETRPYYPSIYHTVVLATLVGGVREASQVAGTVDLYFRPPLENVGLLEFAKIDETVAQGYRAALEVLGRWWEATREGAPTGAGEAPSVRRRSSRSLAALQDGT